MTIDEIIRGESKKAEFKEMPPKNTEKYTKTVVAYANTQGGKLVFGVVDETREVVGIDESILFQTMDSIANAISDSCEPQIVPEIEPYTVEGKTIIVVTVHPEPQRPYYLKSKGVANGTYIRVGGTTRQAHPVKIKELEMEGMRISWDELNCIGYQVSNEAIDTLCKDIERYREEAELPKRKVNREQLINWKLLKDTDGEVTATNAFALMTSDFFPFSKTQCAVFKGTSRSVFLDKREYTGPLYEQIDEALNFVLRNIRLGAEVKGLLRSESYELPVEAIREMIVNAHCHRNMTDESCVQVAIYDDRLEVTSPGGLYNGLTFEDMMHGHSKLRNRAIANVFSQMGLVESWGTGIKKIIDSAKEYGLQEPEFIEMPETFCVNLFRKALPTRSDGDVGENVGESSEKFGESSAKFGESSVKNSAKFGEIMLTGTQMEIVQRIEADNRISAKHISEELSLSVRAIEKNIKELRDKGVLVRHGSARGGYWEVVKMKEL